MSSRSNHDDRLFVLERPRLSSVLDGVLDTSMALVVAPAGYGKTEMIRLWMAERASVATAFLALDERDNDPGHFWQALTARLAEQVPAIGGRPAQLAQLVTPNALELVVEATCGALAEDGTTVVIVLDDFHFIDHPSVLDLVDLFRDEMPSSVHLLVGGRRDPRLPVSRLRMRGDLVGDGSPIFRFTESETAALLVGSGLKLEEGAAEVLYTRTEGWCAALRLAILSMKQASDPMTVLRDLSGSDQTVADYLLEEVISEMEAGQRYFLFSTSVCSEVNAELAEALTAQQHAAQALARLAAEGMFTSAVSDAVGWYEYHRLLRDLLRARLSVEQPARYTELHGLAATWHREHGDGVAAIRHALEAGRVDDASQWLGEIGASLAASGRATTIEELSALVIQASDEPSALALMTRWWALYMIGEPRRQGQPSEIEELGRRLQETIDALPDDGAASGQPVDGGSPVDLIRASTTHYVRALRARARGDVSEVLELDDPAVIPSPSGRVEGFLAEGLLWNERASEAKPLIAVFLEHGEIDRYLPTKVHGLGLEAMASVVSGDFGHAREAVAHARKITDDNGFGDLIQTMYSRLVATWLSWLGGSLTQAEENAVSIQRFCEVAYDVPIVVQHALLRSRVRWSLGDSIGARSLLDRASVTANGRLVDGFFAQRLSMGRAHLDLLDGEFENAERMLPDWKARLANGPESMRERLLLLRMLVCAGGDLAAVHEPVPPGTEIGPLYELELARLRAMALLQESRTDEATTILAQALRLADRAGVMQPMLDDRARLAPILAAASRAAGVALPGLTDGPTSSQTVFVEPLSKRELTVLELMASHLTYAEMADDLYVSPNTVRSHVGAIFRKLAVNWRSEAVTQGRAYGLIK